jgi:hypothetical protein
LRSTSLTAWVYPINVSGSECPKRTLIIKALNRIAPQKKEEKSLATRVKEARAAGCLPSRVTNYMQTPLALRNLATYEDRRLDLAETLIARVAADQLSVWNRGRGSSS